MRVIGDPASENKFLVSNFTQDHITFLQYGQHSIGTHLC